MYTKPIFVYNLCDSLYNKYDFMSFPSAWNFVSIIKYSPFLFFFFSPHVKRITISRSRSDISNSTFLWESSWIQRKEKEKKIQFYDIYFLEKSHSNSRSVAWNVRTRTSTGRRYRDTQLRNFKTVEWFGFQVQRSDSLSENFIPETVINFFIHFLSSFSFYYPFQDFSRHLAKAEHIVEGPYQKLLGVYDDESKRRS